MYVKGFATAPPWLHQHTIMVSLAGSHLYGTNIETSDWDYRGVCIPPRNYIYGIHNFEQYHSPETCSVDMCVYSLRKFVSLGMQCNPNIVEILWSPPDKHVMHHGIWDSLYDIRDAFLSKIAFKSFSGYAKAQLNKIFAQNEKKGTYDSKHAMHLVRLMRMGVEILRDGEVNVVRPDAAYLLAIRDYEVSLDDVVREHNVLYEELWDVRRSSTLPDAPDYDRINMTVMEMTENSLKNGV